jgi:cytochrome c-type biogenesis protein CcmE
MQKKRKSRLSAAAFNGSCIAAAVVLVLASLALISM